MKQIVGILLVKNEDLHIEWVIRNIFDFCDHIIVLDNYSTDDTYAIIERLAANTDKIDLRKWKNPHASQSVLSAYYGTDTWVFGVDGDEVYDPNDLATLRKRIFAGEFDRVWWLRGNFHNCVSLDLNAQMAQGYPAPPAACPVKLFNFKLISGWKDEHRRQRLHGYPIFASGQSTVVLFAFVGDMSSWEGSQLKCLHLCFIARSSSGEFKQLFRLKHLKRRLFRKTSQIRHTVRANPHGAVAGRLKRCAVGEIVGRDISGFLGHVPEAFDNSFTHPVPSLTEQLRQGSGMQLPAVLHLANGETITCLRWIQKKFKSIAGI
ncbi:glycosyltransferase [Candidatus Spongiihabitans sp.]|uniref:glycosyltransferase n=1 Tax=Candidatus Spongiihabitans sp. TaxID=3101308 RepID=UPI003C7C18BA